MDRGAWWAAVHGIPKVIHDSAHTDIDVFHFLIQCRDGVERERVKTKISLHLDITDMDIFRIFSLVLLWKKISLFLESIEVFLLFMSYIIYLRIALLLSLLILFSFLLFFFSLLFCRGSLGILEVNFLSLEVSHIYFLIFLFNFIAFLSCQKWSFFRTFSNII